jgi:nucleoid-associated protein YgaU
MTATFHPRHFNRQHNLRQHTPPLSTERMALVPNYAVRRLMAAVVALAVLALGAIAVVETVGALVDLGGRPAAASEIPAPGSAPVVAPGLHVAAAGDTLWSIAEQYRGEVSRDRFVDALIDLNGGTGIQVGQPVRLP